MIDENFLFESETEFVPDSGMSAEADAVEYDPARFEGEIETPEVINNADYQVKTEIVEVEDTRTAAQRTQDLLDNMNTRRKTLIAILSACGTPKTVEDVAGIVDRAESSSASVYSPAGLCTMLERAGALMRATPDGNSVEEPNDELQTVVEDDMEYLVVSEARPVCWLTTVEGQAVVDAENPEGRARELLEAEQRYLPVYKHMLSRMAAPEGVSSAVLASELNMNNLLREPRMYSMHFIDKLEQEDAIEFHDGNWHATELGVKLLGEMDDVAELDVADVFDPDPDVLIFGD